MLSFPAISGASFYRVKKCCNAYLPIVMGMNRDTKTMCESANLTQNANATDSKRG